MLPFLTVQLGLVVCRLPWTLLRLVPPSQPPACPGQLLHPPHHDSRLCKGGSCPQPLSAESLQPQPRGPRALLLPGCPIKCKKFPSLRAWDRSLSPPGHCTQQKDPSSVPLHQPGMAGCRCWRWIRMLWVRQEPAEGPGLRAGGAGGRGGLGEAHHGLVSAAPWARRVPTPGARPS